MAHWKGKEIMCRFIHVIFRNTSIYHINDVIRAISSWDEVDVVDQSIYPNGKTIQPRVYIIALKERVDPDCVLKRLRGYIEIDSATLLPLFWKPVHRGTS